MEIKKYPLKWKLCFSLATILLLAACNKSNVSPNSVNLPVVEAYLVPGNLISVKLYYQKALTDTAKYGAPITGLTLYISDGTTKLSLTESPAGTYAHSDQNFLVPGKTYTLQFQYLSYAVSAKTTMPTKPSNFSSQYGTLYIISSSTPTTSSLDLLTWDNPDTLNHVLVFLNADQTAFPLGNFRGGNRPYDFEVNTNRTSFYNLTQSTFPYYGHYSIVLERVNQEYIDLLNSNTSSSTSQTLNSVTSNIVNGFGIFTAMQTDTLKLNVFD